MILMSHGQPIFLGERTIERCLDLPGCIDAVEAAFRATASPEHPPAAGVLAFRVENGGFHIKAAVSPGGFFAAKLNGNFPSNPNRHALPTIQGLVLLADANDGRPLAVLHSGAITRIRTAAATGVAIRHLAFPGSRRAALIGCGAQGFDQLRALGAELADPEVRLFDLDPSAAQALASRAREFGIRAVTAPSLDSACRDADVIVTCTTAHTRFLHPGLVESATLIVAAGADHPEKCELDPALMAGSVIITDVTVQCAAFGDLHHALTAGVVTTADVRAELGQVVAGRIEARRTPHERVVFDSTGTAIQDVAAAELAWRCAREAGAGLPLPLLT